MTTNDRVQILPRLHRAFGQPSRRFDQGHRFAEAPGVPLLFGCRVHPSMSLFGKDAANEDNEPQVTTHDQGNEAES